MFEYIEELIETRLETEWTQTEIDFDNVPFSSVIGTSFIRLQVENVDTNLISIGGRSRGYGIILISVFTPAQTGARSGAKMADDLAAIFNLWHYEQLKCGLARVTRIGEEKEWYQLNVEIPFQYDECFQIQT